VIFFNLQSGRPADIESPARCRRGWRTGLPRKKENPRNEVLSPNITRNSTESSTFSNDAVLFWTSRDITIHKKQAAKRKSTVKRTAAPATIDSIAERANRSNRN